MRHRQRLVVVLCFAGILILFKSPRHLSRPVSSQKIQPSLAEILAGMTAYRQWEDDALREYQARSILQASNKSSRMDATMEVRTTYNWPHSLQSMTLRQEGSQFLLKRVFEKLLAAEIEMAAKGQTDIVPQNYEFSFLGADDCVGQRCWHLAISPKNKDKYLLEGEIWVDATDYGVSRVRGSPSKRVSLWVSKVEIDKRLRRIEGVWLPDKVESLIKVRLGDDIRMQIAYNYEALKVVGRSRRAEN